MYMLSRDDKTTALKGSSSRDMVGACVHTPFLSMTHVTRSSASTLSLSLSFCTLRACVIERKRIYTARDTSGMRQCDNDDLYVGRAIDRAENLLIGRCTRIREE